MRSTYGALDRPPRAKRVTVRSRHTARTTASAAANAITANEVAMNADIPFAGERDGDRGERQQPRRRHQVAAQGAIEAD